MSAPALTLGPTAVSVGPTPREALAALAQSLGVEAPLFAADNGDPDAALGAPRFVFFDQRSDLAAAVALQDRWLAAGVALFFVGVAPGRVQIGPVVRPDMPACLRCWDRRTYNNDRGPRATAARDRSAGGPQPMTPAATAMLRELIREHGARAAADPSFLAGGYVRVRTDTLAASRHRFMAVTGCAHCAPPLAPDATDGKLLFGPRPKAHPFDKRAPNPKLTLARLREVFVDRYGGIVKHVFQDTSSTLMPMCSAEMQLLDEDGIESGYGRAENRDASELVAILEAVERYAGHQPHSGRAPIRASYAELSARAPAVDPERFILHDEAHRRDPAFALKTYSPDLPVNWTPAHSMRGDRGVFVPEQFAFYRLRGTPGAPINRFVYDSSNGCSLGGSLEEAALGGLYELVERDAFFATWYTRIPPSRIRTDSIADPRAAALIARAEAEGFEIHLFNITTDISIPAIWAMIVDPAEHATVKSYCASASHGRWNEAIFSALVEVTTSMSVYRRSMGAHRARAEAMLRDSSLVVDMPDHVLLYSLPEAYERLRFLHDGPSVALTDLEAALPSLALPDGLAELEQQVSRVLEVADDVLIVDQGFPALAPLGLACVKVLAPGLLPVTFGQQYRRIGYDRLNAVARFRGVAHPRFDASNVNPFPHNFP